MKTRISLSNAMSPVRIALAHCAKRTPTLSATPDQERLDTLKKVHVNRFLRNTCAVLAVALLPITSASAQETRQTGGIYLAGAERIELADRIRMSSQRMSAMACMIDAGINVSANKDEIADTMAEVDILLDALQNGNADLGVDVAEQDRRMLMAIRGVALQWDTFKEAMNVRLDVGIGSVNGPDYVSRQNMNLMHAAKHLISQTVNQYTIPPALLQNDAFTLRIATRQRAFSQQIAKEACGIMTDNTVLGNQARLANATRLFDASFDALLNGFEAAGVSAPATPEIRSGLMAMSAEWTEAKAMLEQVSDGADPAQIEALYTVLDSLTDQYAALVTLYVEESKSGV